jgi:hypothetical protein
MVQKSVFLLVLSFTAVVLGQESMMDNLLSDQMFQFTWFLNGGLLKNFETTIDPIVKAALIVGFFLWMLQMAKDIYGGLLGESNWKERVFYSVLKLGIICAMATTPFIVFLMRDIIGGIPETIAGTFSEKFMADFYTKQGEYFAMYANSKGNVGSFMTALVTGALVQVVAGLTYLVMNAIALVTPMVQKGVFEMCCYFAPFALIFLLSDYTKQIFDRWLSMSLAVAWLSVIYAIIMWIHVSSTFPAALSAANNNEPFTGIIACVTSIAMMIFAPMISVYLFGATGAGVEKIIGGAQAALGAYAVYKGVKGMANTSKASQGGGGSGSGSGSGSSGGSGSGTGGSVGGGGGNSGGGSSGLSNSGGGFGGRAGSGRTSSGGSGGNFGGTVLSGRSSGAGLGNIEGNEKIQEGSSVPNVGNVKKANNKGSISKNDSSVRGTTDTNVTSSVDGNSKLGKTATIPGQRQNKEGNTYYSSQNSNSSSNNSKKDDYNKNQFVQSAQSAKSLRNFKVDELSDGEVQAYNNNGSDKSESTIPTSNGENVNKNNENS